MKTMSVLNFLSYFLYYLPLVVFALLSLLLLPVLLFIGFFTPLTVSLFLSKYIDFFERQHVKMEAARERLSRKELS